MNDFTEIQIFGLTAISCVLLFYPIFMRIVASMAQPARLRMAELGKELLASPKLSEAQKELVDSYLDDAFDWRFMIFISLLMPVCIALLLVQRKLPRLLQISDPETRERFDELTHCHVIATAAANPLFTIVAGLEAAIIAACLFPFGMLWLLKEVVAKASLTYGHRGAILHSP